MKKLLISFAALATIIVTIATVVSLTSASAPQSTPNPYPEVDWYIKIFMDEDCKMLGQMVHIHGNADGSLDMESSISAEDFATTVDHIENLDVEYERPRLMPSNPDYFKHKYSASSQMDAFHKFINLIRSTK